MKFIIRIRRIYKTDHRARGNRIVINQFEKKPANLMDKLQNNFLLLVRISIEIKSVFDGGEW